MTKWVAENPNAEEEELYALVDLRDAVLDELQLNSEISAGDKKIISEVLELDSIILEKMFEFKSEASSRLAKIKAVRQQKNAYDTHYSTDSYFFDKKK